MFLEKSYEENESEITVNEVKPGDLILYELLEPPSFVEIREDHLKEDLRTNFMVIVDRLICFAEKSMVTHAALITNELEIVEATIPALQTRPFKQEEKFIIHVLRVKDGIDGSLVLNNLPESVDNVKADPDSYAMLMAVLAAVACLFRTKVENLSPKLIKILKCILYKVCEYLDSTIWPFKNGDSTWFCSQLTTYAYDTTAAIEKEPAFALHIATAQENAVKILETILGIDDPDIKNKPLEKPEGYDDLYAIAKNFFETTENATKEETQKELDNSRKFFYAAFRKIFGAEKIDSQEYEKKVIKYLSSFAMPSDLLCSLPNQYRIPNAGTANITK